MSDSTDQYLQRAVRTAENQYHCLYTTLTRTKQRNSWEIKQVRFVAGTRSVNEEHLKGNLGLFQYREGKLDSLRTKLCEKILDECANIFKCMYSCRFNGWTTSLGTNSSSSTPPSSVPSKLDVLTSSGDQRRGVRGQRRTQLN